MTKRLLLVTHHPLESAGGASARWRSFTRHLPETGWEADVAFDPLRLSVAAYAEREEDRRRMERHAAVWSRFARLTTPPYTLMGMKRSAMPLAVPWIVARGAAGLAQRLDRGRYDVMVATGPPMTAILVARRTLEARPIPLVLDLRDLWAGNPAYDRGGRILGRLEDWVFRRATAIVTCTPEAADDLLARHPLVEDKLTVIPNGFEPELLERRSDLTRPTKQPMVLFHSGTLSPTQPLEPLLRVLSDDRYRGAFKLVHHGYTPPEIAESIGAFADRCDVELLPPSSWEDAVRRIAEADVGLFTNMSRGGDATSAAGKVYEYLALGKPVLCATEGGATEAVLTRLGADQYCARLDDSASIAGALDRLLDDPDPPPLSESRLEPYSRRRLAVRMADLLERASTGQPVPGGSVREWDPRSSAA